jgi:hypothetical protein
MFSLLPSLGIILGCMLLTSCTSTTFQSRYVILDKSYPARAENCHIDIFKTDHPSKNFIKISRIDVHIEKMYFVHPSYENELLPEVKKQACLSGADAVIDIEERNSKQFETFIYHVTGTGIKYQ